MSRGRKPAVRPRPMLRAERHGGALRFTLPIHRPPGCDPDAPVSMTEEEARHFLRSSKATFDAQVRERLAKYKAAQKAKAPPEPTR